MFVQYFCLYMGGVGRVLRRVLLGTSFVIGMKGVFRWQFCSSIKREGGV